MNDSRVLFVSKTFEKAAIVGMAGIMAVNLAGCANFKNTITPANRFSSIKPYAIETLSAKKIAEVPLGFERKETQNVTDRGFLIIDDVKNVEPSLEIKVNEDGQLTGFPVKVSQEKLDIVTTYYKAIQKKFPTSNVYYCEDANDTSHWLLYATLGTKLFHRTITINGEPDQYFDYPITYTISEDGSPQVIGEYSTIEMPGEIAVIWKNGFPQFLSDRIKTANGDTYFFKYMIYPSNNSENPWTEIQEVLQMVESERPQYEPGTVVLNPGYSFGGQIEIIQENQKAFYDNFLDSLIRVNRDYFRALKTSGGGEVIDVSSLRTYLEENDWIIPPGVQIPIKSRKYGELYVEMSQPMDKPLSLKNLEISFIKQGDYESSIDYKNKELLYSAYVGEEIGYSLRIGFTINNWENYDSLLLTVAQKKEFDNIGFPKNDGFLSDADIETLNYYISFILYVMRSMQVEPQSQLEKQGSELHNPGKNYYVERINPNTHVGVLCATSTFFADFLQSELTDTAPEIIRLIK